MLYKVMASLPYRIEFEDRGEYLYVEVAADGIDSETAVSYLTDIRDRTDELGHTRVLILRNIPTIARAGTLYFTTKDFNELMGRRRVAFVNPYSDLDKDMKLAMLMASNSGATVTSHTTESDAEAWLLEGRGRSE
jgi:hypothetical protein